MRVRAVVAYDGTDYGGFQRQRNAPTIQAELESALSEITGRPTRILAAGRTDAGVHAIAMPVVFDTERDIPEDGWVRGLNTTLPDDLSVLDASAVPDDFDPRRWAVGKTYRYQVWTAPWRSALLGRYAWHVPRALDLDAMREASIYLLGENDFSSFRARECDSRTTTRNVERIVIAGESGGLVRIEISANAFLRKMARIMAGTLVEVGWGRYQPEDVADMLAARDRTAAGRTAPAHGLFLVEVRYA